jgi:(p)ppGpp synthase/HD superfamily hydrolase
MTDDPEIIAAAVLHDTIEDTKTTYEDILGMFGKRVAELVNTESENKRSDMPPADTWKTRKQETIDALAGEKDPAVKMICLSDKLSNIRQLYRDRKKVGDKVWDRFNQHDPKEHEWYYRSIVELLSDFKDTAAYSEFSDLVNRVFDGIE